MVKQRTLSIFLLPWKQLLTGIQMELPSGFYWKGKPDRNSPDSWSLSPLTWHLTTDTWSLIPDIWSQTLYAWTLRAERVTDCYSREVQGDMDRHCFSEVRSSTVRYIALLELPPSLPPPVTEPLSCWCCPGPLLTHLLLLLLLRALICPVPPAPSKSSCTSS